MSLRALETDFEPPHHHGAAPQIVFPQYEDIDQQNESYMVGMWTFIVQEIMFFGALFLAYSLYRVLYFDAYLDAHRFLNVGWGTANTAVLLTSSFSMATGVWAAQHANKKLLLGCLIFTNLCALGFLGIKYIEYTSKINEGLFPGSGWNYAKALHIFEEEHSGSGGGGNAAAEGGHALEGGSSGAAARQEQAEIGEFASNPKVTFNAAPRVGMNSHILPSPNTIGLPTLAADDQIQETRGRRAKLFFSIYFIMTGLHGIHVLAGIVVMVILGVLVYINHPQVQDYMPTELIGLYWHFVDIVWIFLFPLMYLIS